MERWRGIYGCRNKMELIGRILESLRKYYFAIGMLTLSGKLCFAFLNLQKTFVLVSQYFELSNSVLK